MLDLRFKTGIENELAKDELRCPRGVLPSGEWIDFSRPDLTRLLTLHGFSKPERNGRWTISRRAGFVTTLSSGLESEAMLGMDVSAMVSATRGQTLQVRCGAGPAREISFPPGSVGPTTIAFPVDVSPTGTTLRVQFEMPDAVSAKTLGNGDDDREVGVRIHGLRIVAPVARFGPGETIDFADPNLATSVILSGFGPREPGGCWTFGSHANLTVALPPESNGKEIMELELTALVGASHEQSMQVRCNEGPAHLFSFPAGKSRRTAIRFELVRPTHGKLATIHLELPDATSPRSLGLGDDERVLGVQIHALRLRSGSIGARILSMVRGLFGPPGGRPSP